MSKFGFIGAGKMAGAIVKGMLSSGAVYPCGISCVCGNDDTGKILSDETGIALENSVSKLLEDSEILVLACKPQQLADLHGDGKYAKCRLLVSILAGTSIARLRECFPNVGNIARVMPNMPAQIGQGISCYASEKALDSTEKASLETVLASIGEYLEVPETRLDAVTALSGSGPGYIFEFAAAMIEGGKEIGFSEEESKKLVIKTLLGSAMLLNQSPLSADELCKAVSSPGGTTLAGLAEFEKSEFRKTIVRVLNSAMKRSEELSKL